MYDISGWIQVEIEAQLYAVPQSSFAYLRLYAALEKTSNIRNHVDSMRRNNKSADRDKIS